MKKHYSTIFAILILFSSNIQAMEEQEEYRMCGQPQISPRDFGLYEGPRLSLIQTEASKWPNGTRLFFHFLQDDAVREEQKNAVRSAFQEWKDLHIGLSFQEESDPNKAQIKIGFDQNDGSWSYVGRDTLTYAKGAAKSMNFGWDLTTPYGYATALHEIGHSLGFPHEHQSPFSGIEWDEDAVLQYFQGSPNYWDEKKIRSNILSKLSGKEVRGDIWDPDSVMHYSFKAGLIKSPVKYRDEGIPKNLKLSAMDIKLIRQYYPPPYPIEVQRLFDEQRWYQKTEVEFTETGDVIHIKQQVCSVL